MAETKATTEKSQAIAELYRSDVFKGRVRALCGQKAQRILKGTDSPTQNETDWANSLLGSFIGTEDYVRAMAVEMNPSDASAAETAPDTMYQAAFDVIHPICISSRVTNKSLKSDDAEPPYPA